MSKTAAAAAAAAAIGLVLLPLAGDPYLERLATLSAIFAILALGLNLTAGHLGLFDFGYVVYFGIGGYATSLLTTRYGWSWLASVPVAIGAAAVAGFAIGAVVLRLRGPYFVIATFSFLIVAYYIAVNWTGLTNGPLGLIGVPAAVFTIPGLGTVDALGSTTALELALVGLGVAALVVARVTSTTAGRAWHALRDNEELAVSIGIAPTRYALGGLVVAAALGGLAGAVYAQYIAIMTPEIFSFGHMVDVLLMVVIGGTGTFLGPIAGAFLVVSTPEFLRATESLRLPIFGLILVLTILFAPRGLAALVDGVGARARRYGSLLTATRSDGS